VEESGKVYGYRKLCDGLFDQGIDMLPKPGGVPDPPCRDQGADWFTNAVPASTAAGLPSLSTTRSIGNLT